METTVLAVAGLYFVVSLALGFWVARREKNRADDYFLAGRSLPWYAISLSMTGSNIGTEHFIGMVGTAYAFGLAPATFEWGNFIPYTVLAFIFLPYFFRKKLFTIPEFLEKRYSLSTRVVFAALTMLHMVLAVLVPALYAGGRIVYELATRQTVVQITPMYVGCILLIAGATAAYCIYGGLLSVVWTDVLQVIILVVGGIVLVVAGIYNVGGFEAVVKANLNADATRFSLVLPASHPISPWPGVCTFWLTLSLWYVGTNQFYIQRCLGARSEWDAKMGVIGCAWLKFFLPFIIVFPGLVAFAMFGPGTARDAVYVKMVNALLPPAGRGLLLAALIAAIMSTVSSVLNSASTIWSIDVHQRLINPRISEVGLIRVGRWSTFAIIGIGTVVAPFLIHWEKGIFIYIQDMSALFAPPISVIFLAGFFWRRAHGRAATFTLLVGILLGIALYIIGESLNTKGHPHWLGALLNRAAVSWVCCAVLMALATWFIPRRAEEHYDPDVIWNTRWARLPETDRARNRGWRNVYIWWLFMMSISVGLFLFFW